MYSYEVLRGSFSINVAGKATWKFFLIMCPIPNNHALLSLGCLLLKVPGASALEFESPSIMARQLVKSF